MIGTYAAALLVVCAALPVGAAVLLACGRGEWSWIAPPVGLAAIAIIAWWAVRLPGEGLTALLAIGMIALASAVWASRQITGLGGAAREGGPVAGLALLAASIPFVAEGHFGILGTGFNVDMSQHLLAADWIAQPLAPAPDLVDQGYPLGAHALAVAGAELGGGELATAFSGVTIAVPVVVALSALAALGELPRPRATAAALLVGLPYLTASYLAQGSFTELFQVAFLLGFALALREVAAGRGGEGWRAGVPLGVLAAGALYAYSAPGLAWLLAAAGLWALLELLRVRGGPPDLRGRDQAASSRPLRRGSGPRPARVLPGALAPALAATVTLALLAAPEASRIVEFGGNVESVARAAESPPGPGEARAVRQQRGDDASRGELVVGEPDEFDDRLGNLFGQISPLTALGVWPSGDFRLQPGDGAIPAAVFYLGSLLALAALAVGLAGGVRRAETVLLAALVGAVAIWLSARAISTPYTTAKALQMLSPLILLLAARELLDPSFLPGAAALRRRLPGGSGAVAGTPPRWRLPARAGLALAFVAGAGLSSALALANAPVGPERYSPGIAKLRDQLIGEPVLLLAPGRQLAERHGRAYYGWELRGASPPCVEPIPEAGRFAGRAPGGIRYVLTIGGERPPPFEGLDELARRRGVTLWENRGFVRSAPPPLPGEPEAPTRCELG